MSDDVKSGSNKRKHGKEIKESEEDSDDDDVWENMGIVEDTVSKKTKSKKTKQMYIIHCPSNCLKICDLRHLFDIFTSAILM